MEGVRQWAYTACIAALLLSVLHGLLPVKDLSGVIKLVLSLYIILLLLDPSRIAQFQWKNDWDEPKQQQTTQQLDVTQTILQQAEERLEEQIKAQFALDGLTVNDVVVFCSEQEQSVVLERVVCYLPQEGQDEQIEQSLVQLLGYLPPCEVLYTQ